MIIGIHTSKTDRNLRANSLTGTAALTAIAALSAFAAFTPAARAERFNDRQGAYWGPSLQLGYAHLSTSAAGELPKNGAFGTLALHATHYAPRWSLGGELGFSSILLLANRTADLSHLAVSSLSLSVSGSARFANGWQAGPTLGLLGLTDVSFSQPLAGAPDSSTYLAAVAGLRVGKEVFLWDNHWYVGATAWTDLTVPDRQLWLAGLQLRWEIPFERSVSNEAPVHAAAARPARVATVSRGSVLLNLDSTVLQFEPNLAKLSPEQEQMVARIGQTLAAYRAEWRGLRIFGHADRTGNLLYNVRLSEARAQATANILLTQGLDFNAMSVRGFGSTTPLEMEMSPAAHARNRRVEIWVDGVSRPQALVDAVNQAISVPAQPSPAQPATSP